MKDDVFAKCKNITDTEYITLSYISHLGKVNPGGSRDIYLSENLIYGDIVQVLSNIELKKRAFFVSRE